MTASDTRHVVHRAAETNLEWLWDENDQPTCRGQARKTHTGTAQSKFRSTCRLHTNRQLAFHDDFFLSLSLVIQAASAIMIRLASMHSGRVSGPKWQMSIIQFFGLAALHS